jgi:hypothetical protein
MQELLNKMLRNKADRAQKGPDVPDLRTQWESLLDQVWRSEADWRLWDRLDAAVQADDLRQQRAANRLDKPAL